MSHAISRILRSLAFAGSYLFVAGSLFAHDAHSGWRYDAFCCNGDGMTGDCQQIQADRVRITGDGYQVEIRPGDHRLATVHHLFTIRSAQARRSPDGEYHLCLFPDEYTPRCFYAPDMSF